MNTEETGLKEEPRPPGVGDSELNLEGCIEFKFIPLEI